MLLPSSCVSSLNLSVNSLQDLGAAAIAFVADRCTALTCLNLNSAKIGHAGAAAIAAAMSAAPGSSELPTRAAICQLQPASTRLPLAQVFKNGKVPPGCAACDAPHIEQLQLQLLQQAQGRHHASTGATGITFLEQRYACLFDRCGTGFRMQVRRVACCAPLLSTSILTRFLPGRLVCHRFRPEPQFALRCRRLGHICSAEEQSPAVVAAAETGFLQVELGAVRVKHRQGPWRGGSELSVAGVGHWLERFRRRRHAGAATTFYSQNVQAPTPARSRASLMELFATTNCRG
jgi:hypothetical protein